MNQDGAARGVRRGRLAARRLACRCMQFCARRVFDTRQAARRHGFHAFGRVQVCAQCFLCTEHGRQCTNRPHPTPTLAGYPCSCGPGDPGCEGCSSCKRCASLVRCPGAKATVSDGELADDGALDVHCAVRSARHAASQRARRRAHHARSSARLPPQTLHTPRHCDWPRARTAANPVIRRYLPAPRSMPRCLPWRSVTA